MSTKTTEILTPGVRPKLYHSVEPDERGLYTLLIQPHFVFGTTTQTLYITEDELAQIKQCSAGYVTVQEALPHWSPAKRELLLTGMGDQEFHDYLGKEDDDHEAD